MKWRGQNLFPSSFQQILVLNIAQQFSKDISTKEKIFPKKTIWIWWVRSLALFSCTALTMMPKWKLDHEISDEINYEFKRTINITILDPLVSKILKRLNLFIWQALKFQVRENQLLFKNWRKSNSILMKTSSPFISLRLLIVKRIRYDSPIKWKG